MTRVTTSPLLAQYVSTCPGRTVTLSIGRRLRNPAFTGNVIGNIASDDLSGAPGRSPPLL